MIGQIGQAITFYAHYTEAKVGKTGLTVTVDVYDVDNTTKLVTAGNATEVGAGLYYYTLSAESVDAAGNYTAVFKTATTTVDQRDIPALWVVGRTWVERLDAAVTSRAAASELTALATNMQAIDSVVDSIAETVGAASVIVVNSTGSVSADGGTLYLVRGNSYQDSAGWEPPTWSITGADLPDFSAANIYLRLPGAGDIAMLLTAIAGGYSISGELTAKQTGAINGDYWELVAIWVDELGVTTGVMRILCGVISWQ